MANNSTQNGMYCAFCGKPKELANKLVAGPNGLFICDECLDICNMIIAEEETAHEGDRGVTLLPPKTEE